ncbi:MAG: UvrD-helicase domain-containing protein, partial [Bdellovibrionales bacterium]|nr:UvrD-helicase domain-containing protein [Bdellovibrionales bacterium]
EREAEQLLDVFRETNADAWNWITIPKPVPSAELCAAIEALSGAELPRTKKGTINAHWAKEWDRLIEHARSGSWDQVYLNKIVSRVHSGERTYSREQISDEIARLVAPLIQEARSVILARLKHQIQATYELLASLDRCDRTTQLNHGGMGFQDIKHLLSSARLIHELPELYFRLDQQIRHVLLDEFQDTSRDQWQVLEPIVDEILSKAGEEYSFFCVGDVKQAIYGWRGGVAEIFDALEARYPGLETMPLDQSWRSAPVIMEFVNEVFAGLDACPVLESYQSTVATWLQRYTPHTTARSELPGYVSIGFAAAADDGEDQGEVTLREAAAAVALLRERSPGVSIGVLVRRNGAIPRLMYELKRLGVHASEEGGNPLTDSPAVQLVLSALTLADHPGDLVSRFHLANSPLAAVLGLGDWSDDAGAANVSGAIRSELLKRGLASVVREWVLALTECSDDFDRLRLSQLLDVVYRYGSHSRALRTQTFIEYVRTKRVDLPSEATVRVMTIHKSKGLEFDCIVLPDLDSKFLHSRPHLLLDRPNPLGAPEHVSRYIKKELQAVEPRLERMFQQQREGELREVLSVLYVALTRARHAIQIILAPSVGRGSTYGRMLIESLGLADQIAPGETVYERGEREWYAEVDQELTDSSSRSIASSKSPSLKTLLPRFRERHQPLERLVDKLWTPQAARRRLEEDVRVVGAIERVLPRLGWLVSGSQDECIRKELASISCPEEDRELLVTRLSQIVGVPAIADLYCRERFEEWGAERLDCRFYQRFAIVVAEQLWEVTLHRLVIGLSKGQVVAAEGMIFDTSRVAAPVAVEELSHIDQ